MRPPDTTSPIHNLTRSHPRNLLSMAKSKSARSRNRLCSSNQKRIAQTCCCFRARLAPIRCPSFQGRRSANPGSSGECPIAHLQEAVSFDRTIRSELIISFQIKCSRCDLTRRETKMTCSPAFGVKTPSLKVFSVCLSIEGIGIKLKFCCPTRYREGWRL